MDGKTTISKEDLAMLEAYKENDGGDNYLPHQEQDGVYIEFDANDADQTIHTSLARILYVAHTAIHNPADLHDVIENNGDWIIGITSETSNFPEGKINEDLLNDLFTQNKLKFHVIKNW